MAETLARLELPSAVRGGAGGSESRCGARSQGVGETAGSIGEQPQVTEEQVREYLSQLREVPAEQVRAELLTSTLNTARATARSGPG